MDSITLFIENLVGDLGTNAYLSSNKFDNVDQSKTAGGFQFSSLIPSYRAAPTPDKQQDTAPVLKADPKTVDNTVISGQQGVAKKFRNEGTNTHGRIVDRIYKNKSDVQGSSTGDNLESRLIK